MPLILRLVLLSVESRVVVETEDVYGNESPIPVMYGAVTPLLVYEPVLLVVWPIATVGPAPISAMPPEKS